MRRKAGRSGLTGKPVGPLPKGARGLALALLLACSAAPLEGRTPPGRVVFYNVENLFDTRDDTLTLDDEFTPRGEKRWTRARYEAKLLSVARVVRAAGGEECPLLVGLAEVENRWVLRDLAARTSLAGAGYGVLHRDSPDPRGMDVALLYRREWFRVVDSAFLRVPLSPESTRDILYCEGVLAGRDTLHVFVCHFPSMRGGERRSEWKRGRAASVLRAKIDSLQRARPSAAVLVMGDFNGAFGTPALRLLRLRDPGPLAAGASGRLACADTVLYDTGCWLRRTGRGTYRYQGRWQTLDHIVVSGSLLNGARPLRAASRLAVFDAGFLLETDRSSFGRKPFRTYAGPRYLGGYSDHLPVYIELSFGK